MTVPTDFGPNCGGYGSSELSDDFNAGTALSATYTVSGAPTKVAATGPDGSQAVSYPSLTGQRLRYTVIVPSQRGCIAFDVKRTASLDSVFFVWLNNTTAASGLIEVTAGTTAPPHDRIRIFNNGPSGGLITTDNTVLAGYDGVFINVRILYGFSTYVGAVFTYVFLVFDSFASGATLAASGYTNIGSVSKVAGVGVGGSQAVQASAAFAEFTRVVTPISTRDGAVSFDSKTTRAGENWLVLEVRRASAWIISLYRHDVAGSNTLEVYTNGDSSTPVTTVANFWDATTFRTIRTEWTLSTWNGTSYDANGALRIYKDATLIVNLTAIQLYDSAGGGFSVTWNTVVMGPQGVLDNLGIYDYTASDHAADGYVRVFINDVEEMTATGLTVTGFTTTQQTLANYIAVGGRDCIIDNLTIKRA